MGKVEKIATIYNNSIINIQNKILLVNEYTYATN